MPLTTRNDEQEDNIFAIPIFNNTCQALRDGDGLGMARGEFGGFDGYCGAEAAQFVQYYLHGLVGESLALHKVSV